MSIMLISDETLEKLLVDNKIATEEQLAPLKEEAVRASQPLQETVLASRLIEEPALTKIYAAYIDVPYVEIDPHDILTETLARIPERIARQYNAVIFQADEDGRIHLAMDDPDDIQAISFIEKEIGNDDYLIYGVKRPVLSRDRDLR